MTNIFTCLKTLTAIQPNLPRGTKTEKIKELKTKDTVQVIVHGVGPEEEVESMVGRICERARF